MGTVRFQGEHFMVTIQNYVRAKSLEEAYELNQKKGNCILGGMLWTKMQNRMIQTAIDLCDLGLNEIEETEEEFSIGAMVSLRQLETDAGLNAYTQGAVRDAVKDIVGVQFRNLATVGGSIWGRFGFSDVLTVFLAMDTEVELFQGGRIPLKDFAEKKQDRDILVRLIVKKDCRTLCLRSGPQPEHGLPGDCLCRFLRRGENTGWQSVQDRIGQCFFAMKKSFFPAV